MQLRPYQSDVIAKARHALAQHGSAVLQLPTGGGKTRIAAEIITTTEGPVWFICHRREIINQTVKAFTASGLDFGVVSPRHDFEPHKRIQIVSIDALRGKRERMTAPALVIWDECHHVAADSWAEIRENLSTACHLGLTATPERLDGQGLAEWFAELIVGPSIEDLVGHGYLSQFRYFAPSEPDLTQAKLVAGDYRKKDAAAIMRTPVIIGDAIREYKDKMSGKRAIVFAASVEASQEIAARFNEEGVPAAHVDGTTQDDARAKAVEDLRTGAVKVLCNVEVFTEGFDVPKLDGVILMRPTKSPTLLLQMVGRALRKDNEKQEALILDHAGLHQDHGWFAGDWHWSLGGGAAKERRKLGERGPRKCPECKEVRADRIAVCACGYEFPTGREIGEFDGVLREVRGEVPEGYATTISFAAMLNVRKGTVANWKASGMPGHFGRGGLINVSEAMAWVESNTKLGKQPAEGCEGKRKFTRRLGVSSSMANKWLRRGMPADQHGNPKVPEADEWVAINSRSEKAKPLRHEGELVTFSEIERMAGCTSSTLKRLVRDGVLKAKRVGLRVLIDRKSAMEWVKEGGWEPRLKADVDGEAYEYENRTAFGRRISVTAGTVAYHQKRGLPSTPKGWVHIQRGLEWVRDNTSIPIPPEAWPSANDTNSQEAAA